MGRAASSSPGRTQPQAQGPVSQSSQDVGQVDVRQADLRLLRLAAAWDHGAGGFLVSVAAASLRCWGPVSPSPQDVGRADLRLLRLAAAWDHGAGGFLVSVAAASLRRWRLTSPTPRDLERLRGGAAAMFSVELHTHSDWMVGVAGAWLVGVACECSGDARDRVPGKPCTQVPGAHEESTQHPHGLFRVSRDTAFGTTGASWAPMVSRRGQMLNAGAAMMCTDHLKRNGTVDLVLTNQHSASHKWNTGPDTTTEQHPTKLQPTLLRPPWRKMRPTALLSPETVAVGASPFVNTKEKFLNKIKSATPLNTPMIRKKNYFIAAVDEVLSFSVKKQNGKNTRMWPAGRSLRTPALNHSLIQSDALIFFSAMKAERGEDAVEEKFEVSRGWFMRCKEINHFYNIKIQGEVASADVEVTTSYVEDLAKIMNVATLHNRFLMKCLLGLSQLEKRSQGLASKPQRTEQLLIGTNGAGLLIDNVPGHPRDLRKIYNTINVVFMPANTTSILQHMDQGVILTFKSYYLRIKFCKVIAVIDYDSSDGPEQSKLKTFWKGFTIPDAIKNIHDS
ncbi:hypothetical protein QTO34_007964 [Cnephaeus nilssonii]|uniref:DDE-1 domain-containing protein n=1 Tax=Cnephaeus nilssonii TaxID=3371016 RepID=A0AA40IAH7_CNENI|nr:hypothetical protein QTO34_007964 [Eptesicus nilssonii]